MSVIDNAIAGEVEVDAPAGKPLTSIYIDSASGIFNNDPAQNLGGTFDKDAGNNIFEATFGQSFDSLSVGQVAPAGPSEDSVRTDLSAIGSLLSGGDSGVVDLKYVPEPSSALLLVMGSVGLLFMARRCR